jgi:stage III sporulation protein AA
MESHESKRHTPWKEQILPLLPDMAASAVERFSGDAPITELRLRVGKPMQISFSGYDRLIYAPGGKPMLHVEDCQTLLSNICGQALYAWRDELKNGFVTLPGGHRTGVAGRVIADGGGVERIEDISCFCIRIMREHIGVSEKIVNCISDSRGNLLPALIISPPGCGKTTLLRDIIRAASLGEYALNAKSVSVIDERYELAGCVRGIAQFDLGPRTDIYSGIKKPEGIVRAVAALCPQVIAADELRTGGDADALIYAKSCGIIPLATAHAANTEELFLRGEMRRMLEQRVFSRIVILTRTGGVGTVERVLNADCGEVLAS